MGHARAAKFDASAQRRRSLLAKVHIAKKDLGLVDDDYRAIILEVAGQTSASGLTENELVRVLEAFKAKGWPSRSPTASSQHQTGADHPSARKARALWISLHQLGAIGNPSEQALEAFARHQLGVDRLQWADQTKTYKLIEALKAMAERAGWSQHFNDRTPPDTRLLALKRRLCEAILAKLKERGDAWADWRLEDAAWAMLGLCKAGPLWELGELDLVAKGLSQKLRQPMRAITAPELL